MLRAFFDESGHASDSSIVAIAGFMATEDEWRLFDERWRNVLVEFGVTEFHAAKIGRPYGLYRGWTSERSEQFLQACIDAITAGDLIGISHSVIVADYERVVNANYWFAKKFGSAYRLCYEGSIQAAVNWLRRNPSCAGERLEVTFADNSEYGRSAKLEGERYVNHPLYSAEIAGVSSASAREIAAVQAADLLAYETFKYTREHFEDGTVVSPRGSYLRFFQEMAMSPPRYWDAEGLAHLCLTIAHDEPGLSIRERVSLTRHLLSVG